MEENLQKRRNSRTIATSLEIKQIMDSALLEEENLSSIHENNNDENDRVSSSFLKTVTASNTRSFEELDRAILHDFSSRSRSNSLPLIHVSYTNKTKTFGNDENGKEFSSISHVEKSISYENIESDSDYSRLTVPYSFSSRTGLYKIRKTNSFPKLDFPENGELWLRSSFIE